MKYNIPLHVVLPLWPIIVTNTSNISPGLGLQLTKLQHLMTCFMGNSKKFLLKPMLVASENK